MLVILGNPPYNGFAGMAVDEERELSQAYRTTKQVRRPSRDKDSTTYMSGSSAWRSGASPRRPARAWSASSLIPHGWDGLSFTGMRERYLEAFDVPSGSTISMATGSRPARRRRRVRT